MSATAEQRGWTSQILCRYFLHGVCREGDHCRYSHDRSARPSNICQYYMKGCCTYGDRCRYEHVKPSKTSTPSGSKFSSKTPPRSGPKPVALAKGATTPGGSRLVSLTRQPQSADSGLGDEMLDSPTTKDPEEWVKAAEFVPGKLWAGAVPSSYLAAAQTGVTCPEKKEEPHEHDKKELCPYAAHGECRYGENCVYMHGDICDLCGRAMLHPTNKKQRDDHQQGCIKQHEEDMELSFAVQRSKDKTCGICMEVVVEKNPPTERRFGILSNCTHIFCLSCIRKWRAAKQFENKIIRACPECRLKSDFVTPSRYWVEDKGEKEKLIVGYKKALSLKACKHFDQGRGECPFNEHCFYLHAYPDGRKASPKPIRRRRRQNADGEWEVVNPMMTLDRELDRALMRELERELLRELNRGLDMEWQHDLGARFWDSLWEEDLDSLFFHSFFSDSDIDSDSEDDYM